MKNVAVDDVVINQRSQKNEYSEYPPGHIDVSQYTALFTKNRKAFLIVLFLFLVSGLAKIQLSPRIYRISMMIQPPVAGISSAGDNSLLSPEILKAMIDAGYFNEQLGKKLSLDLDKEKMRLKVEIPAKTNILKISVDVEEGKKGLGVQLFNNLADLISGFSAKQVESASFDISKKIKENEIAIATDNKKKEDLEDEIIGVTSLEEKLRISADLLNNNTADLMGKRLQLVEDNSFVKNRTEMAKKGSSGEGEAANDSSMEKLEELPGNTSSGKWAELDKSSSLNVLSLLLLANFIQGNLDYANQINDRLKDILTYKREINSEIKALNLSVQNRQLVIDRLRMDKNFINDLRIIAEPHVSRFPISPRKVPIFLTFLLMGIFTAGLSAVLIEAHNKNYL